MTSQVKDNKLYFSSRIHLCYTLVQFGNSLVTILSIFLPNPPEIMKTNDKMQYCKNHSAVLTYMYIGQTLIGHAHVTIVWEDICPNQKDNIQAGLSIRRKPLLMNISFLGLGL